MTTKGKDFIKGEVEKQYDRLFKYAHLDSEPNAEQVYTSVKVSEAYLLGMCQAMIQFGIAEDCDWEFGIKALREKVQYDPLTGEFKF